MASSFDGPAGAVFRLREGRGALVLGPQGLRHPRWPRFLGETETPYEDITHHAVNARGLRIATRRSVHVYPRAAFVDARAPDELARGLVERIAALPGGAAQLDRMWEVEKRSARPMPVRACLALAGLCVAVHVAASVGNGDRLFVAGLFSEVLVRAGEWWRLVTANLLHGGWLHLALNVLGLYAIGGLVERVLGPARTLALLGVGAVGGMAFGLPAGYEMTVGASGIVFALVGALLVLELGFARRLPAAWRIPRGLLIGVVAADLALSQVVPFLAGAVHTGGLLAGGAAALVLAPGAFARATPPPAGAGVWAFDAVVLAVLGAGLAAGTATLLREGSPLAPHAQRLAGQPGVAPAMLNDFAWLIATDPSATPADLDVAVRLAERAVAETDRGDPNILDTLAEAQFAAGSPDEAVRTIDEAIALAPGERYFREQRRRFTGERPPGDRPAPPVPGTPPAPRSPPGPDPEPGLRVHAPAAVRGASPA